MAKQKKATKPKSPKTPKLAAKAKTRKVLPRGIMSAMNSAVTKLNRVQKFINA